MSSVARIAKPQMRGLLQSSIKKHLAICITIAGIAGVLHKIYIGDARKKAYADFYKNYDADADFERMKKLGVFQSG